ncbi:MAG TPA: protocatechuate 3,4-dioxygenase [Alphaproteobacteria bacterium]|nr:protocatechuate 3,4-dioxygenase [Alphaproteobacteria bacterium]
MRLPLTSSCHAGQKAITPSTPTITRRGLAAGIAGACAGLLLPLPGRAARLTPTPGQTEGPFYPVSFPADADGDLVRVQGQAAEAVGQVAHVNGRVLDRMGRPVPGAVVEIWQCDAQGRYRHPRAPGSELFDSGFQGYGRSAVDDEGFYRFRTIRPVPYTGRTPHIHFAVNVPGTGRLVTQMYVEGEPLNERDGVLNRIRDPEARRTVIVPLVSVPAIEPGALRGRFDIVLDL